VTTYVTKLVFRSPRRLLIAPQNPAAISRVDQRKRSIFGRLAPTRNGSLVLRGLLHWRGLVRSLRRVDCHRPIRPADMEVSLWKWDLNTRFLKSVIDRNGQLALNPRENLNACPAMQLEVEGAAAESFEKSLRRRIRSEPPDGCARRRVKSRSPVPRMADGADAAFGVSPDRGAVGGCSAACTAVQPNNHKGTVNRAICLNRLMVVPTGRRLAFLEASYSSKWPRSPLCI
jgi:hypothetical protein